MTNIPIATSRFNNDTWQENCKYRAKINSPHGCIYGCPLKITPKVPLDSLLFVVEMNNSTNQIEGIGLIRNSVKCDKYYNIYSTHNYNRYVYKSEYRIHRDLIEKYNTDLVKCLEYILFREKTHMKRGSGLKIIPEKLLKHEKCRNIDLQDEIRKIFREMRLLIEEECAEIKELKIEN